MQSKFMVGTMLWGTRTSAAEAHNIIRVALDAGVNTFDTAQKYPTFPYNDQTFGLSEIILGDWIRKNSTPIQISTKLASPVQPADIRQAVDDSLTRLGTDVIDYCHIHWPNRPHYHFRRVWDYNPTTTNTVAALDYFDQCSDILTQLTSEGKIKHICMSNETAWGITQWAGRLKLSYVQQEYSLLHRLFELDVAEACHHNNVKLLAWSPLAAGLLTGKYSTTRTPSGSRRSYGCLGPRDNPNVWEPVRKYKQIADDLGVDLSHLAIAWLQRNLQLEAIILGATTSQQLSYNLSVKLVLDTSTIEKIQAVYREHPLPF